MKINHHWINQYCGLDLSVDKMVTRLTLLGLEVGQVKTRAEAFSGVIVAEVQQAEQHPNADKLRVCKVFDGSETYDVVCGAPNARAGIKVAFAKIGAVLPGNFKIKKSKIRGEVSHGMLCSSRELGLGDEHDGIIELSQEAPLGEDLRVYKNLDDSILDIELTPNRGDCFSLRGVVRELCADQNVPFVDFSLKTHPIEHAEKIEVLLSDESCPVFSGCLIKNVDCNAHTPAWMVDVLEDSGVRSVSLIVDITNYIMLTLGQPMHAYDATHLNGNIEVRKACAGDSLRLLDLSKPELKEGELLLITSKQQSKETQVLGLAGIMGGAECGVSDKTTHIYFEAAHFEPQYITGKARGLGMQTEASMRFERGVDPTTTAIAISHACELVKQISGGELGEIITTHHARYEDYIKENTPSISLSLNKIKDILGIDVSLPFVQETLTKINIPVTKQNEDSLQVQSPIHRFDLAIVEDYCEEIARHYGYENILKAASHTQQPHQLPENSDQAYSKKRLCKRHLSSLGLSETISYCFVNDKQQKQLFPEQPNCRLLNPISSDMDVMRVSLLPGLLSSIAYNNHRQAHSMGLFELGLCFIPNVTDVKSLADIQQTEKLAFALNNQWRSRHWRGEKSVDFYIIKGVFESIVKLLCVSELNDIKYDTQHLPAYMHPGQSAHILCNGVKVGVLGMLHPLTLEAFDIRDSVGFCEIDWSLIGVPQSKIKYQAFSTYPKVYRDLAMLVPIQMSVEQLTLAITSWKIKYLCDAQIFDVYQGDKVEQGMKSIALCFQFASNNETLSEEQINKSFNAIQEKLVKELAVVIRNK